jgi:hypothetical protein
MNALNELRQRVIPPAIPHNIPTDFAWTTLEESQNVSDSYKAICRMYGVGLFSDFLHFYSANYQTTYNIQSRTDQLRGIQLANVRGGIRVPELLLPDRFFPLDKLGQFVFAGSIDGHTLLYKRTKDPQLENVILYNVDYNVTEFDVGVVKFLSGIYAGEIDIPGFSKCLLEKPEFVPVKTTWNWEK